MCWIDNVGNRTAGLICDSINLYFLKSPKSQVCLSRLVVKTIISQCIILFSRYIGFSFEPFSCCFLHLLFTNLSRHHVYLCSFEAIFFNVIFKKKSFTFPRSIFIKILIWCLECLKVPEKTLHQYVALFWVWVNRKLKKKYGYILRYIDPPDNPRSLK